MANPNFQRAAELIQADWAKVGAHRDDRQLRVDEVSRGRQEEGALARSRSAGPATTCDPDNFFATLFSCSAIGVSNYSFPARRDFEDLIQKAKKTSDQAERTKLYEQAQVVFEKQAPAFFLLAHSQVYTVTRKNVNRMDPLGNPSLRRCRQDRIDSTASCRRPPPIGDPLPSQQDHPHSPDAVRDNDLRLRLRATAARRPDPGDGRRAWRDARAL